jgi:hypothetical protein
MKKTFSVNLGNRVYNIDEDAYLMLSAYLERIEGHFSDLKEREDILNDIELRISELFSERLGVNKQVVTLVDVNEVIRIMGDPHEISGSEEEPRSTWERRSGTKRIYRDPDDRMIGGVCAGLAAYTNIILWIVVPEARTTAQKLEMRGDSVNASNIGNFFKDEFENVKKSFRRKRR